MTTAGGKFRTMIAGLAELGPVGLRGTEYTGVGLSQQVAIDPAQPDWEAERTPQLVSELGRLVAAAYRDKEMADAEYRVWREKMVHDLTNNLDVAKAAGFACVEEGKDARGKPKPGKPPSREAAEGYMRTTPEYLARYRTKLDAEEAWTTLSYALEAAKSRTWAIRGYERSGSDQSRRPEAPPGDGPADLPTDVYATRRGDDAADLARREEEVAAMPRSPLPPMPSQAAQTPPAEPEKNDTAAARRPAPPPPPTRTAEEAR